MDIRIGTHLIGDGHPTFVIAEAGINHNGSLDLAKQLVDVAGFARASAVKFQMRDAEELFRAGVTEDMSGEDIGFQYIMHLIKHCELSRDEYAQLAAYCASKGLLFLCTPWDRRSVDVLDDLGVPAFKIASADMTNLELLEHAASKRKPLLVSTGMSTLAEIDTTVAFLRNLKTEFVLLHCNSAYPAAFKDINLRFIQTLRSRFGCLVGYSGHELGIAVSSAAVVAGACVIERHFTLDRTMRGPDHAMSLEPQGLQKLVRDIRHVEEALGTGVRVMTRGEYMNRKVLGKSVVAVQAIASGERITPEMVTVKSPAHGLSPQKARELYGRVARRDIPEGGYFYESDLSDAPPASRRFESTREWGLIVRYHDYAEILGDATPPMVEFHFSSHDLDMQPPLSVIRGRKLVVHAPELFGDQLLDLCASDEPARRRSVANVQHSIDVARKLREFFPDTPSPLKFVLHVGGMTYDHPVDDLEKDRMYLALERSLKEVDFAGVDVLLENLPPSPWYKGGQWWSNVFTDAGRIRRFCESSGFAICYDTSHAQLFCNAAGIPQTEYLDELKRLVRHIHVADGSGTDGEGLQIGDGDVDFQALAPTLLETGASYTPEIWMGHKEHGEGFWVALHRLRAYGF